MAKFKKGLVQNRYRRDGAAARQPGMLRVVGVSFLNSQPHLHGLLNGLAHDRMQVSLAEPSELARRLYEDEADVGLCPVVPLATHGGFELVPNVAIGCDGAVRSILIVGDVPIEEAEQMYLALRKQKIPARMVRYPETYHGGWSPWNTVHRYYEEMKWWERYLAPPSKTTSSAPR